MSDFDKDENKGKARRIVPADEQAYDLDIREVPRAAPSVGIFDAPFRCYRVNLEWDKHIGGAVQVLSEWRAWTGDEDERNIGTQAILEYLAQNYACGDEEMPTLLRQNPTNDCQLQQSNDNGETWSTVFDFSLCEVNVQVNQSGNYYDFSENGVVTYNDYVSNYTTVNEFVPALVYDDTDEDYYRNQALCWACNVFYESFSAVYTDRIRTANGYQTVINVVTAAIGTVFGALTGGVGGIIAGAIVGAVLTAIVNVGLDLAGNYTETQLDEIQDEIVCCMYTNLKDATISQSEFELSLDGCDLSDLGQDIATVMTDILLDDDSFIVFLKLWEEGYRIGQVGILPACPCADEDTEWTYDSDFPVDPNGWTPSVNSAGNPTAVWAVTTGWSQTSSLINTPNQYWRSCVIEVNFSRPVYITDFSGVFNLTKGSYSGNITAHRLRALLGGKTGTLVASTETLANSASNGTGKTMSITPNGMVDYLEFFVRSSQQLTASYSGTAKITSIHIEGTGHEPGELTQVIE